jgi:hypothetical protein
MLSEATKDDIMQLIVLLSKDKSGVVGGAQSVFFTGLQTEQLEKMVQDFEPTTVRQIEYVLLVGFHHIVGSQVEYTYPPLQDCDDNLTTDFVQKIA